MSMQKRLERLEEQAKADAPQESDGEPLDMSALPEAEQARLRELVVKLMRPDTRNTQARWREPDPDRISQDELDELGFLMWKCKRPKPGELHGTGELPDCDCDSCKFWRAYTGAPFTPNELITARMWPAGIWTPYRRRTQRPQA